MRNNKNNPKKVLLGTIFLISLVAFSIFSTAAVNGESVKRVIALEKPLVIQVGSDINIQSAVDTITDNIDQDVRVTKVISSTDPNNLLGSYNSIFFVGHGSEKGIGQSEEALLSWQSVKTIINRYSSAKAYIISCNADKFVIDNNIRAFGTPGTIDAELGAYLSIVKFLMDTGADTDILRDSLDNMLTVSRTKPEEDYLTLALVVDSGDGGDTTTTTTTTTTSTSEGVWSTAEKIGAIIDTVVCFICAATSAYYIKSAILTAAKIAIVAVAGQIALVAMYLVQLAMGDIDVGRFLSAMFFVLVGICFQVIKNLAWWHAMTISASFAVFVTSAGVTAGGSLALVIALTAISLGMIGWTIYLDIQDSNPYYAM